VPEAGRLIEQAIDRGDQLLSVTPVRTEILRGLLRGELAATAELLVGLDWLDVDAVLADRAAELGRPCARSHPGIAVVDLLLAAATERLGARLLTRNVRDFPMIPGLEPAY